MIQSTWQERIHEYLGGTVKGLDGFAQGIGESKTSFMSRVEFKATHRLSAFMQKQKNSSSTWVHGVIGWKSLLGKKATANFRSPNRSPNEVSAGIPSGCVILVRW
jgi:hypothetical protein